MNPRARRSAIVVAVLVLAGLLAGWLFTGPDGGEGRTQASPGPVQTGTPSPGPTASPSRGTDPQSGLPWIAEADLPREARETLRLIDAGGPYPYDKDGSTFGNFEGLLPQERRGYYREYTVETPGARNRGARRIVTGDNDRTFFWTDDHYESFARIQR